MPPRPVLPPLNALRAFEAAARHESFARAAQELGVTPAAISHQVKALEQWLGARLFLRKAQGLDLTEIGRASLPGFARAFDALGAAVQDLRAEAPGARLNIATLPSLAQLWLTPRLPRLRKAFPQIKLSIHALETPPNFRREPFDFALFFVEGGTRSGRKIALLEDAIFPVCSPEMSRPLRTPADLRQLTWLHDTTWTNDWSIWLSGTGAGGVETQDPLFFSLYSVAVQAAIDGAGVLMAHESLVAEPLRSGALVAPFPSRIKTGLELSILLPDRARPDALRIVNWLANEGV